MALAPSLIAPERFQIKVGVLGDSQIGKTTLIVRYVEGKFDEDYMETLGFNCMEKTVTIRDFKVTISIWDLGGQKEFASLMPLVCSDARVMIFAFDLTQKSSLFAVKRWYKEARSESKNFVPFLIGTKHDLFTLMPDAYKQEITKQSRKFSGKMKAPLIYCSSSKGVNVKKIFKIIVAKVFALKSKIKEHTDELTGPICEYKLDGSGYDDVAEATAAAERRKKRKKKKKSSAAAGH